MNLINRVLYKDHKEIEWLDDCLRIQRIINIYSKYMVSLATAEWIWQQYSDSKCAGWLSLPDDDEELKRILLEEQY